MDLKRLIFSLLFSLCAGMFVSFGAVRLSRVGHNYFFYHGLGTAVLALGAWALLAPASFGLLPLAFAVTCGLFALLPNRKPLSFAVFFTGLFFAAQVLGRLGTGPSWLYPVGLFTSAGLLGFTMAAMLLGHWYLSVPGLSIDELRRVTLLFFLVLGARTLIASVGLAPLLAGKTEIELYRYFFSSTAGIFLTMRWFWGLLGPIGLSYFIWDTVRLGSTRSATGILYVAVVFVLIGETISQYLAFFHGLPS